MINLQRNRSELFFVMVGEYLLNEVFPFRYFHTHIVNLGVIIMKRIFVSIVLATSIIACSKDKFKTEPQVDIKSFGPAEVTKGELFTLRAEVTDKEGDVQDSVLLVRKRYNAGVALPADT